ncbi:MAG: hypothetical protein ACD_38C00185G0021 [uncultured bacterium]|nr:MAG: hypothetical protein ACD_38C00185G0021 [uncultured bacterium]
MLCLINGVSLVSSLGATTSFWKIEGIIKEVNPTITVKKIATKRGAILPLIP